LVILPSMMCAGTEREVGLESLDSDASDWTSVITHTVCWDVKDLPSLRQRIPVCKVTLEDSVCLQMDRVSDMVGWCSEQSEGGRGS
jgi:hypothetical protein